MPPERTLLITGADQAKLAREHSGLPESSIIGEPEKRDTAACIGLARDAAGSFAFPDAGPAGGSILGLPLLTTRHSPRDSSGGQLALIDGSGIAVADHGVGLARSTDATIEADTEPTGATDTPVAQSAHPVSLFQTDTVAVKGWTYANWERERDCATYISGAIYPTGAQS